MMNSLLPLSVLLALTLSPRLDVRHEVESFPLPGAPRIDGLFIAPDGRMFAAGTYKGQHVHRIHEDGRHEEIASGLAGPTDLGMDGAGNLYVTNFNSASVSRITPEGEVSIHARVRPGPAGIVVEEDGSVFVAHYGSGNGTGRSLTRIDREGNVDTFVRSDELIAPIGLARGPGGHLYAASFVDGNIFQVDEEGVIEPFARILLPNGRPASIGHISAGNGGLIATTGPGNRLYFVDRDGEVSLLAGDGSPTAEDGPLGEATFHHPNGLAEAPNGDVYVATAGNGPGDRGVLRRLKFTAVEEPGEREE